MTDATTKLNDFLSVELSCWPTCQAWRTFSHIQESYNNFTLYGKAQRHSKSFA